jgi:hypothetical protein
MTTDRRPGGPVGQLRNAGHEQQQHNNRSDDEDERGNRLMAINLVDSFLRRPLDDTGTFNILNEYMNK